MRKIIVFIFSVLLLASCKNKQGELSGLQQKKWFPEKPKGMTLIEGGSFVMGSQDEDIAGQKNAPLKTVSVRSFFMDETEITNSEYRQFVHWVRDSVTLSLLARKVDELGSSANDENGIGKYAFKDADTASLSEFQKYMRENYYDVSEDFYAGRALNWDAEIEWNPENYMDQAYAEVMDSMYLPPDVWYNGQMKIDVKKFVYQYLFFDAEAAARAGANSSKGRMQFIQKKELEIYPDTTVWIKDFSYSYNEPMHNNYFSHPAYDEYPVVGVSWEQAVAFCNWRTRIKNNFLKGKKKPPVSDFRLPSEAEWEYAARGGLPSATYPWGSPYLLDDRGCFLANFKPLRGDYAADQALYTVEAKSYYPNDYNLYNMAGNVSEWTGSSYDPLSYDYVSSLNPNLSLKEEERKVIRGGSWKDVAYFLRVSTRDYEYQDTARSYIGFRTVQDYLGSKSVKMK